MFIIVTLNVLVPKLEGVGDAVILGVTVCVVVTVGV